MLKNKSGFTLIELMIALAINAILLSGLLYLFTANLAHYQRVVNINRLNQQLQSTLELMANDIRRAGYWGNARNDVGSATNNNPFVATGADLTISGSCILFTYDQNNNGTLPSISSSVDDERYGYMLTNGAVQARPPGGTFACNATDWENITDPNVINITALSFTQTTKTVTTGPATRGLTMRSVDISISGRLVSDTTVTKTMTMHVRLRNDKFIP